MTRSIRVLHLEDSPRDAEMIRHRLDVADVSCDIVLANSKDSFEAALTREPFDLIISDYNLPGYDGMTALKQAQATQPDVPPSRKRRRGAHDSVSRRRSARAKLERPLSWTR
jgi:CheY-like chemotaxis protein